LAKAKIILSSSVRRRLLTDYVLTILSVSISSDRKSITIVTSYLPADILTSYVTVSFAGGILVSQAGQIYQTSTATFSLASPSFFQSYYTVFVSNRSAKALGIFFTCFSLLLVVLSLILLSAKSQYIHEFFAFALLIQLLGLLRIRPMPINFEVYNILRGFSLYELWFIPNIFTAIFGSNYE